MKKEVFLKQIEAYYGEYKNSFVKQFVISYLDNFVEEKLKTLLKVVMESHPVKYGAPDLAALKEAHTAYAKETGSDLKKIVENQQWVEQVELTDEEKISAVSEHEKFLENMKTMALIKTEKKVVNRCKDCMFVPMPLDSNFEPSSECSGCIDFSNFKIKTQR